MRKNRVQENDHDSAGSSGVISRAGRFLRRWHLSGRKLALGLLLVGATSAIVFNAIVLQPARHPAPLFAVVDAARAVSDKPAAAAPRNTIAAPVVQKRETAAEKPNDEKPVIKAERAPEKSEKPAEKVEKLQKSPIITASIPQKPAPKSSGGDPLGELIRAGVLPPAPIPSEPDARLMNVQKNLSRLGYLSGKPDGLMGPGTRIAIEKYERNKKWAVTGEMSPQLVRELGAVAARRD